MIRATATRFGLLDALILGAAIALGSWAALAEQKDIEAALGLGSGQAEFDAGIGKSIREDERERQAARGPSAIDKWKRWRNSLLEVGGVFLPIVTLGASVATFRHRAARRRRALRQIGVLTTALAAIAVAVSLANEYTLRRFAILQVGYTHNHFASLWRDLGIELGLAIVAFWTVFAIGRYWRCAPTWADRLGRALGVGWVANAILGDLLMYALGID